MNEYALSSLIAFILLGMGISAGIVGTINYLENRSSKRGRQMFFVCWCVFFWNFGYAWMSMCYDDDFAYVARAIALLSISFYMYFVIKYVSYVAHYPGKKLNIVLWIFVILSLVAWTQIIQKNAVSFVRTPWGYWYNSAMSWARGLQFVSIFGILVLYYVVTKYAKKNATTKREMYVLKQFDWFGPILMAGYTLDAVFPMVFKTTAIPGSCIAAFFSSMVLYRVSRQNKTFGLSVSNVSEYVFRDVSIPVLITNDKKNIILFNDVTPVYLNCSEDKILNSTMDCFFVRENDVDIRVLNSDKICKFDQTEVKDQFGELLYTIFFVQDISEEKKQARLLEESRELAESANLAKSEFLANMSHEIRTPLNAVLGIDEMILRETEDKAIIDYAENIKQAGNMLLSLINDILDFSKIESGKMEINEVEFSSKQLFNDIELIAEKRLQEKDIKLIYDIDSNLPSVLLGDDVRIRQILINILTNSIKYTNSGSIVLSVKEQSRTSNEIVVHASVKDTGIGIKEEDLKKLFNAFERVDVKKNRNVEGTGLGLSITNELLVLMNSKLCVKSEYEKGSEFYFDLRLKVVDFAPIGTVDLKKNESEKREKTKSATFTAPDANVLIVDDNKVNLKVAAGLLKRTSINVETVLSGMESIELVKQNKYDIIFMDHMMPQMDGIETVAQIKELGDFPSKDATIIALTANAISGAKEMFLNNGFDDFIAKPIKVNELEEKLLQYLPKEKIKYTNN